MDDPAKTGTGPAPPTGVPPDTQVDEFADVPSPRTRHPALALGAALLALFLVAKMRSDAMYFFASRTPADLGDARSLFASERGRAVLAGGTNQLVLVHGTPDRESALQVDTKGSWTFTQFFRILGTGSRLFVHRREDPLPGFRAESDAFEGRLIRFADLSFEDSIRAYFAGHVSATHFFRPEDIRRAVTALGTNTVSVPDMTGDAVTLGPNDILAVDLRHEGEVEVVLPATGHFATPEGARAAIAARGATILRAGLPAPEHQSWIIAVSADARDRVLDTVGNLDEHAQLRDVRETVKVRLSDLATDGSVLSVRAGATLPAAPEAASAAPAPGGPRALTGIITVRTLATVQIPPDAFLVIEAETPREHMSDVAITLVLLVFASVNLVGLVKGLRRR